MVERSKRAKSRGMLTASRDREGRFELMPAVARTCQSPFSAPGDIDTSNFPISRIWREREREDMCVCVSVSGSAVPTNLAEKARQK